ncbi:hypothetical protein F4780DRAFT_783159 [Xylariomycetidae sp. FL0641]|nr:hypothetical protein F4780DRAFT_783159 [Xylariomycetidae sp. FL0641]
MSSEGHEYRPPMIITPREYDISHYYEPVAGRFFNLLLIIVASSLCCSFFWRRLGAIRNWRKLPYLIWLLLALYVDSYLFLLGSSILEFTYSANQNLAVCQATILFCITLYLSTKLLIYLFLVERAVSLPRLLWFLAPPILTRGQHIIKGTTVPRFKSRMYIFHNVAIIGFTLIFMILLLIFRMYSIENNLCMISVQHDVLICVIIMDVTVNVYLTGLFLRPIIQSHSFNMKSLAEGRKPWSRNRHQSAIDAKLHALTIRTFVGTCCTLLSSLANLVGQMVFDGQPYWLCLLCCEADILFSTVVLHCITNNEHIAARSPAESANTHPRTTYFGLELPADPADSGLPTPATARRSVADSVVAQLEEPIALAPPPSHYVTKGGSMA